MPAKPVLTKTLIGPSGEHFVLSRLYRQGLLAALAPPGTPIVDVLVLSPDGKTIAATLQVKTSTGGAKTGWRLTRSTSASSKTGCSTPWWTSRQAPWSPMCSPARWSPKCCARPTERGSPLRLGRARR